jgi:hypothetical protein
MSTQSNRSRQLSSFAGSMPVANQRVADSLQANRMMSLQQAVSQATAQPNRAQVQQAGAQQAQAAGQIQVQQAQANQQGAAQAANMELEQKQMEAREALANRQLALQKKQRDGLSKLSALDSRLKDELWDKQLRFEQDELGRQTFNERQLMDYKLSQVKSEEDWANYEQEVRQVSDRRMQLLKTAYSQVQQQLKQASQANEQELDQAQKVRLIEAKRAIEEKIRREKARQANRAAAFQAGGTIVGAVAGAAVTGGSPAGAMVGASIGGGLAQVASGSGLFG